QPTRFRPAVFEELIVRIKHYLAAAHMLRTDYTFRREIGQLPYDVDSGCVERKWKEALTRCYRILLGEYGPNRIDAASKEFLITNKRFGTLAECNGGDFNVYTTNYDCSFQVLAANSTNLAFMTHIDSDNGRFTERWHPGNPVVTPETRKIYVHRLHGCIGWFNISLAPDPGSIIKEVYGAGADLDIQDDDFLDLMCIKLLQSQLVGTNPAFASAFDEFCSDLRSVKTLLVWGFSFRDLEVVRAINHSFSERQT